MRWRIISRRFISRRPARFDELGLGRVLADRMAPSLIAAMAFLAALAVGGWLSTAALVRHWEGGAESALTVQVPRAGEPDTKGAGTRLSAVQGLLIAAPGVESAKPLSEDQLNALLRPWIGGDVKELAVSVPAVIAVHMTGELKDLTGLVALLEQNAPGTIVEDHAPWAGRLDTLAGILQLCAGLVLALVTLVTAAVIAIATRSGLVARWETILVVYQLGATDGYIARRFAARAAIQASVGGAIGGLSALAVVFAVATIAGPLSEGGAQGVAPDTAAVLPLPLWLLPVALPAAAAAIGYATTQITIRRWLRRLP